MKWVGFCVMINEFLGLHMHYKKVVKAACFLIFSVGMILAGGYYQKVIAQTDSTYIQPFSESLSLSPHYDLRKYNLRFRLKGNKYDKSVLYYPTVRNVIGLRAAYKGIVLGFGIRGPRTNFQKENYGRTRYLDFNVKYTSQTGIVVEWLFKYYKSLTDINTPVYTANWQEGDDFYIRDDLGVLYNRFNFSYIFSKEKFSYRSAFDFIEKQKLSAGSFMALASIAYLDVNADSSFITPVLQDQFTNFSDLERLRAFGIGIGPGYVYNYVYRNFSMSVAGFAGMEIQRYNYDRESNQRNVPGLKALPLLGVRTGIGYNGEKYFAGIAGTFDFNFLNVSDLKVSSYYHNIAFLVGIRLAPPKFLRKLDDFEPLNELRR